MRVVVVGGGAAGFSAAVVAKRAGAEVTLIERTDMLGGLGLVGEGNTSVSLSGLRFNKLRAVAHCNDMEKRG